MTKQRIIFPVEGLTCGGGGALTAERSLARTTGVIRAYVNSATEMAYVEYDPTAVSPEGLAAAVERVGLRAGPPRDH